ncbi:hypothetical protein HO133_007990 [Letharia lupina]|uniref:Uncharacterized protein n=1 Tax=Letharia lupina TaxID=560253 RepID=A0A8H6FHA8_9LECA|nr:uncharacterized protein HO133_007990 [Letharia lupina]KAF6228260.1 hypothetical protein HO133_007990 [Letharia lupina]
MPDSKEQAQAAEQEAQNAKDPSHPAHPQHPKHGEWLKNAGKKFGNAAIFGAGATAGSDAIQGAISNA